MYPLEKDTPAAAVSKTMKGKYQDQSYPLSYKDEFRACQALVISKEQLGSGNDFKSTLTVRQTHQMLSPRTVSSPVLSVSADPKKQDSFLLKATQQTNKSRLLQLQVKMTCSSMPRQILIIWSTKLYLQVIQCSGKAT